MLGLEHEVVVLVGLEQLHDRSSADIVLEAVLHLGVEVDRHLPKLSFTETTGIPARLAFFLSFAICLAMGTANRKSCSPSGNSRSLMTSMRRIATSALSARCRADPNSWLACVVLARW